MSVNIKQNGELVKIANNVSIVQADWNDRENTDKNTSIKNQPETIKTMADLIGCQDENALAGAMAVVEALDYQKVGNLYELICDSLESFVISTATNIETPSIGRFNDPQKSWTPDGNVTHSWYRFIITYQNPYVTGSSLNIYGNGIFWHDDGRMWNVFITGNKDAGLSVKYDLVNKPTIKTREDLMANTVSGLFPDALAVKDAINGIRATKFTGRQLSTLEEFINLIASSDEVDSGEIFKAGIVKDLGGWGPTGNTGEWYKYMLVSQNPYKEGHSFPTTCQGIFMTEDGKSWVVRIYGKKGEELKLEHTSLNEETTIESIDPSNITITLNNIATDAGLTASDFTIQDSLVAHYGGLSHSISLGIHCTKTIPAGTVLTLEFANINFQKSLGTWGVHPTAQAYAGLQNDSKTIICNYLKEADNRFYFWPVIQYNSASPIRTVKI